MDLEAVGVGVEDCCRFVSHRTLCFLFPHKAVLHRRLLLPVKYLQAAFRPRLTVSFHESGQFEEFVGAEAAPLVAAISLILLLSTCNVL